MFVLAARSRSRSLQPAPELRVLAVFARVCDLATPDGAVIALVSPDIGDGPLNIVVAGLETALEGVQPGMTAAWQGDRLRVGPLTVSLAEAAPWDPRPDWTYLRLRRRRIHEHLALLRGLVPDLQDLTGLPKPVRSLLEMAGRGPGLTPAGDDFLMGVMLRAWLDRPEPEAWCRRLAEAAAPRTTTLAAAMLRAAARGECDAAWHALLTALVGGQTAALAAALERVLAHGHTSGADTLVGFLDRDQYGTRTKVPVSAKKT